MSKVRVVPDQAARDRIARELDKNLLVEAGAGSGKTEELARRMAAGIAAGVYTLEQMAAVTFTRKAAAELRGRFQLALERALAESKSDASRDRLRHALSNLERFFAGTIHAFCARLLRERPVEAGVSPGFTELDEVEEALVMRQSWRDYRAQARGRGDADVLALLDANITAKKLDKAFETVCLYEDVQFPPGNAEMPDVDAAWTSLESFWTKLQALLPVPMPAETETTCNTQKRAIRFERQWRGFQRGERDAKLLADCLETWRSKPSIVQMRWTPKTHSRLAEQLHADFRDQTVIPYLTAWRQYLYRHCVTLLTRARDAARDERGRRNALSFSDLLILTADVLRTNGDVRRALQEKYRWLFVDEFQDTDPVQAEIMFLLAADERDDRLPLFEHTSDADWRVVPLRPGALFVVGDPKQSIYRFRRADIDIYNEVRARLGGTGGIVKLTTNFRSLPGLCTFANDVFKERFPAAPTTHAPMFAPLDHYREAERRGPDIAVIDLPETMDSKQVAGEEASRIARYIRAEVDAGRRQFGDFLILTRKKRNLRPYADALESLQVPIEVTGAGAFGESEEVRTLALLLSALADPQDAVTLVGVLRGPLFGLSDRDLFAFRQADGYFNLFAEIPALVAPGFSPASAGQAIDPAALKVNDALATLRRWSTWTRMLPAGAALERILDDSGYLALAATSQGGVEAGDLLHAIDRVRAVVEDGFTLAEAAAALASWSGLDEDNRMDEPAEVDSLPLEPGRRDVVRLMNLHKAKGLEAAVVFLADPLGGFDPRVDVRIVRQRDGAFGYFQIQEEFRSGGRRVIAEPKDWEKHSADEKAYLDAEGDRLLYVAATRARDMLVVGRYSGKAGGRTPAWDALTKKLRGTAELNIPTAASPAIAAPADLSTDAAASAMAASTSAHARARRESWDATSVTAEAKRLPTVEVETTSSSVDPDPTHAIVPATRSHRADAGMAWGTLIHGLLEHAMRHPSATRADLRRLAMWLTVEEPQLRNVIDQALDTVESVARAEFWRDARAAAQRHEEVPFSIRSTAGSVPIVVGGTIDLVYQTADGWRLLDYKTDTDLGDAETQSRYARQLEAYSTAWKQITGAGVTTEVIPARKP